MRAKLTSAVPGFASSEALDERLTPLRRHVLGLLEARGGKATAYELVRDLALESNSAAPATIYRALHYLIRSGLVRRVATTNTFIISKPSNTDHQMIMVCINCGAIALVLNEPLQKILMTAAQEARFFVAGQETEIKGICETCTNTNTRLGSDRFATA